MQIKVFKFQSGERYPALLDDSGVPDFWVTHYVTQNLRLTITANGIETFLRAMKHLKSWESINGRNLIREISKGKIPALDDIKSIKSHCFLQAKSIHSPKSNNKVIKMNKLYMPKSNKPTVNSTQAKLRYSYINKYLHDIGMEAVKHKPMASQLFDELNQMHDTFINNKPRGGVNREKDKSGIPSEVFESFVDVAKVNSENNPFKDKSIKFRNYLLVQILYETGMRASEVLALQIDDIGTQTDRPTLNVIRRHDNPDDPRTKEPTAKTIEREIEITQSLRKLIIQYVNDYRSRLLGSKKHPFIFVSHKGKKGCYEKGDPLKVGYLNDIFIKIIKVIPGYFEGISPHQFRHYSNERLSDHIDARKVEVALEVERLESEGKTQAAKQYYYEHHINEARELEIRAQLNGHSSVESGLTYLKRTTRKKASIIRNKISKAIKNKMKDIGEI